MVSIELTKEELEKIINMMSGSSIQMGFAEEGLKLFNKLKEANK